MKISEAALRESKSLWTYRSFQAFCQGNPYIFIAVGPCLEMEYGVI